MAAVRPERESDRCAANYRVVCRGGGNSVGRKRVVKAPEERRRELMDAARELFVKVGYEQTSVSDVVKHIGVAQGTFYWYFQSKDEILTAIMQEIVDRYFSLVEAIAAEPGHGAIEKLKLIEAGIFQLALESPEMMQTFHLRAAAPIHDKINDEAAQRLLPVLAGIIREGIAEGTFRVESPELAAFFIITVVDGFFDRLTRGIGAAPPFMQPTDGSVPWPPPEPWPQLHRSMWEFVLRGLGVAEPLPID